jgi:hypothetical protein
MTTKSGQKEYHSAMSTQYSVAGAPAKESKRYDEHKATMMSVLL